MELGLVCRDIPFGCDEKSNKRTLYRVTDPFLRFWYSFALPNYSDPYYLSSPEEVAPHSATRRGRRGYFAGRRVGGARSCAPLPGYGAQLKAAERRFNNHLNRTGFSQTVI